MESERIISKNRPAGRKGHSASLDRANRSASSKMCPFETTAKRAAILAMGLGTVLLCGITIVRAQEAPTVGGIDLKSADAVGKASARLAAPGQFVAGTISGSVVDGS